MKLLQKRENIIKQINALKDELYNVDKEIYNQQLKRFIVTDERSGRTFTRNSYESSLKYPKLHTETGKEHIQNLHIGINILFNFKTTRSQVNI